MKKLTKIRLINWHYLTNETIDVNGHILLSGPNASGKSTIMDAIMFVITAGDTNFNMAANDKSKRDLKGYVKCKLGLDDKEYLRDGDVTGHVSLEFYDEKTEEYFTVGAVIDAFGDMMPVKTLFYKVNSKIENNWFTNEENIILSTVQFRKAHPEFDFYLTKKEAKRGFRNAFGSINEDFFKLIPKALAFKPISDVKEFIYQNVLEEKEIDVTAIKDTIRSYKELETTLNLIKDKITDLTEITTTYNELAKIMDEQNYRKYLAVLFEVEKIKLDIVDLKNNIDNDQVKKANKETELRNIEREINALNQRSKEVYNALSTDDTFRVSENLSREIEVRERNIEELEADNLVFLKDTANFKDRVNSLRRLVNKKIFDEIGNMSLVNLNNNEVEMTKLKLSQAKSLVDEYKQEANQKLGALNSERQEIVEEVQEITDTLKKLQYNQINFPDALVRLRRELVESLKRIYNYDIPVFIFAELVEIKDQAWADTIEVFLGNRRFNLIVEPRYFDQALQIYARIKNKYNLYNTGLVNTKQIAQYTTYDKNSLASIMTSENVDALHYINMTCGKVIMCKNELELENYNTSITNDLLLYSGYTVRALNPNIDKPFCGKDAYLAQQDVWNKRGLEARNRYHDITNRIDEVKNTIELYNSLDFNRILVGVEGATKLEYEKDTLKGLYLQKEHLNTLSTKELQQDYDHILTTIKNNEIKKTETIKEIGRIDQNIDNTYQEISNLEASLKQRDYDLKELANDDINIKEKANKEFNDLIENATYKEAFNKYKQKYDNNDTSFDVLNDALVKKQYDYINKYDSNFSIGINEIKAYFDELYKLEKSELVKYEQKVRSAREDAELIFKEDFIAKLRANIEQAEIEIGKINDTLSKIHFGNDTYEFIFPRSTEYAQFYEMVTSDIETNAQGIFTSSFEAKYEQQIKELFDSLTVDEVNSKGAINKFTDYRTYMDYDIKITNKDGESMTYSKVFKEKSGGETQVPFYVAIIASFVRIYTKTNSIGGDPIGLIMFDEVFDKMDSNRMRAMMDFISSMPIQTIIACPPQRMNILEDYSDTILIMARQGTKAQVMNLMFNKGE